MVKNPPLNAGETLVQLLIGEDPTCRGASRPVGPNYWTCALEPGSCNCWAHVPQLLKPTHHRASAPQKRPLQWGARAPLWSVAPHLPLLEKGPCSNDDPAQPKVKKENFKILYTHLIRRYLGEKVNDLGEKMNGPSEEYMIQQMWQFVTVCLGVGPTSSLFPEIYENWVPLGGFVLKQMKFRELFPESFISQVPSMQNNQYSKATYFRLTFPELLQRPTPVSIWVITLNVCYSHGREETLVLTSHCCVLLQK